MSTISQASDREFSEQDLHESAHTCLLASPQLFLLDCSYEDAQGKEHHSGSAQNGCNRILCNCKSCWVTGEQRQRGCTEAGHVSSMYGHRHAFKSPDLAVKRLLCEGSATGSMPAKQGNVRASVCAAHCTMRQPACSQLQDCIAARISHRHFYRQAGTLC